MTNTLETVAFILGTDGQWKASSYLIKPQSDASALDQTAAITAAQKWLTEIDDGHYAESWTDAAEIFRQAVTQDQWISALEKVRRPLGKKETRNLVLVVPSNQMPGGPDGKYMVMQCQTVFTGLSPVTETVTFTQEKDGRWKASGYYIK